MRFCSVLLSLMIPLICFAQSASLGETGSSQLTPAIFKKEHRRLKEHVKNQAPDKVPDYTAEDGTEASAALRYLNGLYWKELGELQGARTELRESKRLLTELSAKPGFKSAFNLQLSEIQTALKAVVEEQYRRYPLITDGIIRSAASKNSNLVPVFINGRAYVRNDDDSKARLYRVSSFSEYCAKARSLFKRRYVLLDGKPLILEYERAIYGERVIYDACSEKLQSEVQKAYRGSWHYPEEDDVTKGLQTSTNIRALSAVGPLFSYLVKKKSVDIQQASSEELVTLDLRKNKPAKFDDWFAKESFSTPCPSKEELAKSPDGEYMHCKTGGRANRNQFVFRKLDKIAELSFYTRNYGFGEAFQHTFAAGSAVPSDALLNAVKRNGPKNAVFADPKDLEN